MSRYTDPSELPSFYDPEHPDNTGESYRSRREDEDAAYERMRQYKIDHPEEFADE